MNIVRQYDDYLGVSFHCTQCGWSVCGYDDDKEDHGNEWHCFKRQVNRFVYNLKENLETYKHFGIRLERKGFKLVWVRYCVDCGVQEGERHRPNCIPF